VPGLKISRAPDSHTRRSSIFHDDDDGLLTARVVRRDRIDRERAKAQMPRDVGELAELGADEARSESRKEERRARRGAIRLRCCPAWIDSQHALFASVRGDVA
jgi:hypothetical protein